MNRIILKMEGEGILAECIAMPLKRIPKAQDNLAFFAKNLFNLI